MSLNFGSAAWALSVGRSQMGLMKRAHRKLVSYAKIKKTISVIQTESKIATDRLSDASEFTFPCGAP